MSIKAKFLNSSLLIPIINIVIRIAHDKIDDIANNISLDTYIIY